MSVSTQVTLGLVTAASMFVGVGIGYMVAEKRLTKKFEERLETETKGMREFYTHTPAEKFATPEEAVAALIPDEAPIEKKVEFSAAHPRPDTQKVEYHKIAKQYEAPTAEEEVSEEPPRAETDVVEAQNAFQQESIRQRGQIYLITPEEFAEGDYLSANLTWYKDGVLTDSDEEKIDPPASHVGLITMANFGELSGDPNVMLVRNEVMSLDFEIVRSVSSYVVEVLGGVDEPESTRPSQRGD